MSGSTTNEQTPGPRSRRFWRRPWPLRTALGLFALSLVLPAVLFFGLQYRTALSEKRSEIEHENLQLARSVAADINRELMIKYAELAALATSPALVNLDWATTFTPELLRKDLDLGLELGREMDVPMPVTAAAREVLQTHFGAAKLQRNPDEYLQKDFSALMETMALAAGMTLASENTPVPTGLES